MQQRKLRLIKPEQSNSTPAFGITIPPQIAILFRDVYFTFAVSGTAVILTSGTKITIEQDVKGFDLNDFR